MAAVRTFVMYRFGVDVAVYEGSAADFALKLSITTVVVIKIHMRSTADRTYNIFRNRASVVPAYRLEFLAIAMFVVTYEETPVLFEKRYDVGELVDLELLIFRRTGIVVDPLFCGNEFADKFQQKYDLFGLLLNDVDKIKYNVHEQFLSSWRNGLW